MEEKRCRGIELGDILGMPIIVSEDSGLGSQQGLGSKPEVMKLSRPSSSLHHFLWRMRPGWSANKSNSNNTPLGLNSFHSCLFPIHTNPLQSQPHIARKIRKSSSDIEEVALHGIAKV